MGYGTGRGNGGMHRSGPGVPERGTHGAIKQAFMRDRAALGGRGSMVDVWDHLSKVKCR